MEQKVYKLMHKDYFICNLLIDINSGNICDVGNISDYKRLPVYSLEEKHSSIDYQKILSDWWKKRAVPATRKGLPVALSLLNKQSTGQLLVDNLGLSLSDHYWIKPANSEIQWSNVNMYDNNFCDVIGDFQFTNDESELLSLCHKTIFIPSASMQGELKKKWIIDEKGNRALIKGNYDGNIQQSINEVFISNLHQKQNAFDYTLYNYVNIDIENGKTVGCICNNFTNSKLEFVPAIDICGARHQKNDESVFAQFVDVCCKNGLDKTYVENFLQYQILIDFITTNTDRHFSNFGVLRDSDTLEYKMMAPIFDNGNSMLWNQSGALSNYLDVAVSSFSKKEVNLLKYVKNKDLVNTAKLPTSQDVYEKYSLDGYISEKKKQIILDTYNNKCELYNMFLNGYDLSKEAYLTRNNPKNYYNISLSNDIEKTPTGDIPSYEEDDDLSL